MSRKKVNAICRKFPGAEVSDPWGGGHDAWKVGGKMFACIRRGYAWGVGQDRQHRNGGNADRCRDWREGSLLSPVMGELAVGTSEDELRHRLSISYKLVRSGLSKKLQAQLDPFE